VPSLQAIEQTVINPMDEMSEEEMSIQALALITSRPQLVIAALDADPGLRAQVKAHIEGRPSVVDQQQTQRTTDSAA
jgi:hypothetical protein